MTLETFQLLSPELILLLTGLVVLCVDLAWRDEGKKTIWVPALALAGLGAALVATILLLGTPSTTILAMILLGEAMGIAQLWGSILILGSVVALRVWEGRVRTRSVFVK